MKMCLHGCGNCQPPRYSTIILWTGLFHQQSHKMCSKLWQSLALTNSHITMGVGSAQRYMSCVHVLTQSRNVIINCTTMCLELNFSYWYLFILCFSAFIIHNWMKPSLEKEGHTQLFPYVTLETAMDMHRQLSSSALIFMAETGGQGSVIFLYLGSYGIYCPRCL